MSPRTRVGEGSLDMTMPVFCIMADISVVFEPGAAAMSSTLSPGLRLQGQRRRHRRRLLHVDEPDEVLDPLAQTLALLQAEAELEPGQRLRPQVGHQLKHLVPRRFERVHAERPPERPLHGIKERVEVRYEP